jgi:asparagine synthase (glutamine-hydrolysing)
LIPNRVIQEVFRPIRKETEHVWTRDIFRNVFQRHLSSITRSEDYINHSLYFEAKTFLHGLFVVEDKLSMSHGLETRVPFMDNDLVDFAMKLPVRLKLQNLTEVVRLNENEPAPKPQKYFQRVKDGKLILRKVMERYIPAEVTNGIKQGFSAPDASWFRGESIDYVKRVVYNNRADIYQFMDREVVQRLVDEHLQGKQNRRLLIWSLLNFEWWLRHYQNKECI